MKNFHGEKAGMNIGGESSGHPLVVDKLEAVRHSRVRLMHSNTFGRIVSPGMSMWVGSKTKDQYGLVLFPRLGLIRIASSAFTNPCWFIRPLLNLSKESICNHIFIQVLSECCLCSLAIHNYPQLSNYEFFQKLSSPYSHCGMKFR